MSPALPHTAATVIPLSFAESPDVRLMGGVISIGNFDGVHLGHAMLLRRLRALADQIGGPAVAVTFDPPPASLLRPGQIPPQLTTISRREVLLHRCGVDGVVVIRTTHDLLSQSPEAFFHSVVVGSLQARGIVEGPNFFFGRNRAGNPHLLARLCAAAAIECEIVQPETSGDRMVSSTRIRELLSAGDVVNARELLTAGYRIQGAVGAGAGRGRTLGFPTANLNQVSTLVPGAGVYACWAIIDGNVYPAAVNVGANPTFGENDYKIEAHLIDFSGDLYDCMLEIEFVARIRPVQPFSNSESLKEQLDRDILQIRQVLEGSPYS